MDELNDIFRQAAADYTLQPTPRVWEAVALDLDKCERRRRGLIWWWSLLGILVLGIAGYLLLAGVPGTGTREPAGNEPRRQAPAAVPASQRIDRSATNDAAAPVPASQDKVGIIYTPSNHTDSDVRLDISCREIRKAEILSTLRSAAVRKLGNAEPVPVPYKIRYAVAAFEPTLYTLRVDHRPRPAAIRPVAVDSPAYLSLGRSAALLPEPAPVMDNPTDKEVDLPLLTGRAPVSLPVADLNARHKRPERHPPAIGLARGIPAALPTARTQMRTVLSRQSISPALMPVPELKHPIPPREYFSILPGSVTNLLPAAAPAANPPQSLPLHELAAAGSGLGSPAIPLQETETLQPAEPQAAGRPKASRWSLAAGMSVNSSWHKTRDSSLATIVDDSTRDRRAFISPGYHLRIGYQATPWLEISSGLGFQTLGERYGAVQPVKNHGIGTSNILPLLRQQLIGDDSGAMLRTRYSYLEIPLGLKLRLLEMRRFSLLLDAGISANALIRNDGYAFDSVQNGYLPLDGSKAATWLAAYSGGLTLRYSLSRHWSAELQGWYRHIPEAVFTDEQNSIRKHYRQAGAGLMLRYQLTSRARR